MAWEENSCISLNMQLIAILSRIGVKIHVFQTYEDKRVSVKSIVVSDFYDNHKPSYLTIADQTSWSEFSFAVITVLY